MRDVLKEAGLLGEKLPVTRCQLPEQGEEQLSVAGCQLPESAGENPHPGLANGGRDEGGAQGTGEVACATQTTKLAAALVVEIPMRWGPGSEKLEMELAAKRCRYEGVGGRCEREAWREGLCRRHDYWERLQPYGMGMVCPDDRAGVQEVLRRTLSLVLAGLLTPEQARLIMEICRAMLKTM